MNKPRIQDALSKLLAALKFTQMSKDVLTCEDRETLTKYARCVVKNSPKEKQRELTTLFYQARLF